jgi:hypothetical protein
LRKVAAPVCGVTGEVGARASAEALAAGCARRFRRASGPWCGLTACELAQLAFERRDPGVDRVDHRERDLDPFARIAGQRQALQERASGAGA